MEYHNFLTEIVKYITILPEQDVTLKLENVVVKNTARIKTVSLYRGNRRVSAMVYLAPFYDMLRSGSDIRDVANEIDNVLQMTIGLGETNPGIFLNAARARRYLTIRLLPYEQSRELLKIVPYKQWLDLALVCQLIFPCMDNKSYGGAIVYKRHLKLWGIQQDDLFNVALESMSKYFSPKIVPAWEYLGLDGEEEDIRDVYLLTNSVSFCGAASILTPGVTEKLSELFNGEYYLLASSMHEMLVMPKRGRDAKNLRQLSIGMNSLQFCNEEELSEKIYEYSLESRSVVISEC